jgi:hypothetical protein
MKKYTFLLLALLGLASANAQPSAKSLFLAMPDSFTPLLTTVNRADCIDFLESQMKARVKNRMGSQSEMTVLSVDYIRIQMTEQSDWQMKVLLQGKDTLIAVVTTACAPVCDSSIHFYTTNWNPVADYFSPPVMDDFFRSDLDSLTADTLRSLREKLDLSLIRLTFSADDDTLLAELTTPEYLDSEAAEALRPYLFTIRYRWERGGFRK